MTTRDERFLAAWDDLCEISPDDIVERWAAIAEDYPGDWVQLAVNLCAGLPEETSEPEFFTLPSGETVALRLPTWRDAVARLVGEIRSAAFSMGLRWSTRFRPGPQPSRQWREHISVLADIAVILQREGCVRSILHPPDRRASGASPDPGPAQDVGRTIAADWAAAGRKTQ